MCVCEREHAHIRVWETESMVMCVCVWKRERREKWESVWVSVYVSHSHTFILFPISSLKILFTELENKQFSPCPISMRKLFVNECNISFTSIIDTHFVQSKDHLSSICLLHNWYKWLPRCFQDNKAINNVFCHAAISKNYLSFDKKISREQSL